MATTPFFLWPTHASSSDHDMAGLVAEEETAAAATEAAQQQQLSPELAAAVARPRLRRQGSSPAKQQQQAGGGGGTKKPPQRGLGVAELERLRCGGDPLRDLNAAVAAAAAMGDASSAAANGHNVINHHHLSVPTFGADSGGRHHYAPVLVRPAPPPPTPPPAATPFCYLHHSSSSPAGGVGGGHNVAPPEQQFLMRDRWGCSNMGGFAAGAGAGHLLPLAPEHPSNQSSNTIWRPASSSSCLHNGHRCDLCSKTMVRALAERGTRGAPTNGPVAAAAMPDYSFYDLAAAMATARKGKGQGLFLGRERKNGDEAGEKEVREIEFFPASTASHHDESEFATTAAEAAAGFTPAFSSSAGGGCGAVTLDLSLRL
uniref:Uncharacterized protein n=1 Tax=Leersia perrieri TaxID=77586 RepID=A0A0D9WIB6_9ORYZ